MLRLTPIPPTPPDSARRSAAAFRESCARLERAPPAACCAIHVHFQAAPARSIRFANGCKEGSAPLRRAVRARFGGASTLPNATYAPLDAGPALPFAPDPPSGEPFGRP